MQLAEDIIIIELCSLASQPIPQGHLGSGSARLIIMYVHVIKSSNWCYKYC